MTNYVVLTFVDLLYALQFLCEKVFQDRNETSLVSALNFSLGSSIVICVYSLAIIRFHVELTVFSLSIAAIIAVITITLNFFSILSLSYVNLSVYSTMMMMGGMLIPSLYGIIFLREAITVGKAIGTLLVIIAMLCGIKDGAKKKGAWKYYIAVFVINGLFATSQKIHQVYVDMNVSAGNLMLLSGIFAAVFAFLCILILEGKCGFRFFTKKQSLLSMTSFGITNCSAEVLSMSVMTFLPASVQFAFVSGGVILFSTMISIIKKEQQDRRSFITILLAIAALVLVGL